ncbi:MAG: cytochrome c [Nitrospira sp.]|nr:cytochrome c [Nitrospira sp.]
MRVAVQAVLIVSIGVLISCGAEDGGSGDGPIVPPPPPPPEYAEKHMPVGWWNDQAKMEEGRKIYLGEANPDVNCASCHGKDGKPVKAGARDFRNVERMKLASDSVWFWRIAEGVPNTKMKGWKSKLSEEDMWKLVLYERSFALSGKAWSDEKKQWIDIGSIPTASAGEE